MHLVDCDGPASIVNNFSGEASIGFPSVVVLAATWNTDLAKAYGESMGKMGDEMDVAGWYAPAMNTHRTAFGGRNFEYYSEDGLLAGKMAAQAVAGAQEYGLYVNIKHFALNDQETNRTSSLCTWANEQSIREIYLKPFELAVKEGGAVGVMSSYNFIGTVPAQAHSGLLNTILRDEWGFVGLVRTDYFGGFGYQNADRSIRSGNDLMLVAYDAGTNYVSDTTSATSVKAMRQSCKNILYTLVNSRAFAPENLNKGLATWKKEAIAADVVIGAAVIALAVLSVKKYRTRVSESSLSTETGEN